MADSSGPLTGALVNATYPVDYFTLSGVDPIPSPSTLYWASRERFAATGGDHTSYQSIQNGGFQTSEYLQIDLGRSRPINYLCMSVLKAPIEITIEYDATSATDGTHSWVPVTALSNAQFDDQIHYEAQHKNPWHESQFYFTTFSGDMVVTQYLRIRFARRDVDWPIKNATPFRWPILVKQLRVARYIRGSQDVVGILFESTPVNSETAPAPLTPMTSKDLRQQFALPSDAVRKTVNPHILGFSVLCDISSNALDQFSMQWSLWDVTNPSENVRLDSGVKNGVATEGLSWIDVFFDPFEPISTDSTMPRIYEIRVSSLNTSVCQAFGTQKSQSIPGLSINGGPVPNATGTGYNTVASGTLYTFTSGSANVTTNVDVTQYLTTGQTIQKQGRTDGVYQIQSLSWNGTTGTITLASPFIGVSETTGVIIVLPLKIFGDTSGTPTTTFTQSLTMRLWGDTVDTGRDILGNTYRYATQYSEAEDTLVSAAAGWQCAPQPSPDAVEALYYDIRTLQNGVPTSTAVDAIRVAPRTPGVVMHVYYTEANKNSMDNGQLRAPQTREEWDQLLWTPVNSTFVLQKNQIYTMPKQIRASYIKLEFTRLKPIPFAVPSRPSLPAVEFRRYPTWIESQFNNALLRRVVQDWFIQNKTRVEVDVLKTMTNPIQEFQYKEREFLAALALGKVQANQSNQSIINVTQKALIDPVTGSKIQFNTTDMYKSTLVGNVDKSSVLGQVVLSRFNSNNPTDTVEGTSSVTNSIPISSTPNNRISESFSFLARIPMWFNQVSRHVYKIDKAEFQTQAFYVGIDQVEFLRKDYTVFRDDAIIQDNLTDTDQLEENSFIPDTPSVIANAIYGNNIQTGNAINTVTAYVNYTVNNVNYTDEAVTFTALNSSISLNGQGGVAQNVSVTSDPGGGGTKFQYGRDFDIVFGTNPITGSTINNIQVANFADKFVVTRAIDNIDADTVMGISNIFADEEYTPVDITSLSTTESIIISVALPSAVDSTGHAESLTAMGVAAPSAAEVYTTNQNIDAATVTANFPTSTNPALTAEATTFADSNLNINQLTGIMLQQGAPLTDVTDTTAAFTSYPDLELFSMWIGWKTIQPTSRTDFVWPAALDASIDDAEAKGYRVALRIACGGDTPSWVYTDATNPVQSITTIATDLVTGQITMPVPWDANLLILYKNLLTLLQAKLDPINASGLTPGGNRRCNYIYFIPVSMGMETGLGCGMNLTYGAAATYTGSATLASNITSNTTTFTATGANSGAYPTGSFLAQIDSELFYVNRVGGQDVLTVNTNGRGWSGSTATSHSSGTTVKYASSVPWTGTFLGNTGPYDPSVQNQTQWLAIGTLVSNKNNLLTAWQNAADANVSLVTNFSGVPSMLSYGQNFDDNYSNALTIAQIKTRQYVNQLWGMIVDLQPGKDGGNNPTKNGQATYYEGYSVTGGLVVRAIVNNGGTLGLQAAPPAVFNGFTNPYSGSGSAFRSVVTDSLSAFSPDFLEVSSTILNSGP